MTRKTQAGLIRAARAGLTLTAITITSAALLNAQFRSSDWVTSGFDAQRTAWQRGDTRLTKTAVQKGEFKFLWQAKFDNEARQLNSLTEPVLQDLLIGYRGFKTLAFVGGSNDRLFAIDTDLAKPVLDGESELRRGDGRSARELVGMPRRTDRRAQPPRQSRAAGVQSGGRSRRRPWRTRGERGG